MKVDNNLHQKILELKKNKGYVDSLDLGCEKFLRTGSSTLDCIVLFQSHYFSTGDRTHLIPMVYKDIANLLDKDISTIARAVEGRSFRICNTTIFYKDLFKEGVLKNKQGRVIHQTEFFDAIMEIISNENKKKPYSDDTITTFLKEKGYDIARRTVTKYRKDFLGIPSSHHRC